MQSFSENQGSELKEPPLTQYKGNHTTFNTKNVNLHVTVLILAPVD